MHVRVSQSNIPLVQPMQVGQVLCVPPAHHRRRPHRSGTSGDGAQQCCTQPAAWPAGSQWWGTPSVRTLITLLHGNRRMAHARTSNRWYKDSLVAIQPMACIHVEGLVLVLSDWRQKRMDLLPTQRAQPNRTLWVKLIVRWRHSRWTGTDDTPCPATWAN